MAQSRTHTTRRLAWTLVLIPISGVFLFCGEIIFFGPMLVAMAPTFLLVGVASGATLVAQLFMRRSWMVWGFFGLALVVLGLNTRLPTFAHDLLAIEWVDERFGQPLTMNVAQAVTLRVEGPPITARRAAYDYAAPQCFGEACFIVRNYRSPHAYWRENPEKSVLTAGLALADGSERAPLLAISSSKNDHLLTVNLTLYETGGRAISTARYVYRTGFAAEPPDFSDYVGLETDRAQTLRMARNFMLHGNLINIVLGDAAVPVTEFPVQQFLARNIIVQSDATQLGGIRSVTLEVLAEKVYDPALEFKGEHGEAPAEPWPDKGWDAERSKNCDTLFRRQLFETQLRKGEDWWRFDGDVNGRRKIRRTMNELCEEDTVWSIDYASKRGHVQIAKYNASGQLQYEVSFKAPATIGMYHGGISQKTFHEKDGYVYFEWRNEERPAGRLLIKRNMALRFPIPGAGGAK